MKVKKMPKKKLKTPNGQREKELGLLYGRRNQKYVW